MMPGAVGTLSPSDSVGPVGHVGTLSPSDSVGPVGSVGTLSPSDSASVGPVGPVGTLSPSNSVYVGHDGPDGTLSSSDLAGKLFPAVAAGIPFPAGPVGTLSPSDFEYVGPVGTLFPLIMWNDCLRLFLLVSCRQWILLVDPWGVISSGLDGISGQEGPCYYTVACRSVCRG